MNYQTGETWFYKPLWLFIVLLALFFAFLGFPAGFNYLLLAGVIFPVIVSMRIHRLKETGGVILPDQSSEWMVYIHGIPVYEQRRILKNPCFPAQQRAHRFFVLSFTLKLIIQLICIAINGRNLAAQPLEATSISIAGVIFIALLYVTLNTVNSLHQLITHKVSFLPLALTNEKNDVQAWFSGTGGRISALDRLFSLK